MITIVKYEAEWCHICKGIEGVLKTVHYDQRKIKRIDITNNDALAEELGIRNLPLFIIRDEKGKELERFGAVTTEEFNKIVDKYE